ncbi:MAG: TerC family protein, partial [Betaproteobacteria bacterium]
MDAIVLWLQTPFLGQPTGFWLAFLAIVVTLLVLDLGVLHRRERAIGVTESLLLSAGYIGIALVFGGWVWHTLGAERGMEYLTGF